MTVTLGGYPAKQCARRTHNQYTPGPKERVVVSPDIQARLDEGIVFERTVFDEFHRRHDGSAQFLALDDSSGSAETKRRTSAAMRAGVSVIIGGQLPDVNGRAGAPDVLIRHRGGYLPVDIKNHKTVRPSGKSEIEVSSLTTPDRRTRLPGYTNRGGRWRDDVMQLAHYTRMLQELGWYPDRAPIGGIIGSSDLPPDDGRVITWYDLDAETITSYSASDPTHRRKRSALQRYDHEFGFRLTVARAALAGDELVRPYRIKECDTCEWFDYCADVVGPNDASFAIATGHLDVREWQYLYQHCGDDGRLSVAQLADIDPAAHAAGFREQSVGTQKPGDRLAAAVRRAQLTVDGVDIEWLGPDPPEVPGADIEVDFDIEWDRHGRIYQWGLRIRDGQDDTTARYESVCSFEPLDEAAEEALAARFADRLRDLRNRADRDGASLRIFHWSHPETSLTRKFSAVKEVLDGLTLDLCRWFSSHYFARTSASIKDVAATLGFSWAVDDPGGAVSQLKIETARGSGPEADAARQWCLAYNESDVAAQAAIRDALRGQHHPPRRSPK